MTYVWEQDASTASDQGDLLPPQEKTFTEAQQGTNFVVFAPGWLPADSAVTEVTLRPEQPPGRPADVAASDYGLTPWSEANPSSVRAVIEGEGRRLRIKQFLYDWAVPAASTAPLWKSDVLRPFICQDAIGWLGTDYMGRQGACVQLKRTQIEVSIQKGAFSDDEMQRLLKGLAVADPEWAAVVQTIPFHTLNYFARYRVVGPDVPYGLWAYHAARRYSHSRRVPQDALNEESPVPVPVLDHTDYVFDSAVVIDEPDENHREVEVLYRHRENRSDYLWLVAMNPDSDIALPETPEAEAHPAETRHTEALRGRTVFVAALTEAHGAWEALWRERGTAFAVWASASSFLNGKKFREVVEEVQISA